jgi:hypothetical protein
MVDQRYIDKSSDHGYAVGQHLVITRSQVHRLAKVVTMLVGGLRQLVIDQGGTV